MTARHRPASIVAGFAASSSLPAAAQAKRYTDIKTPPLPALRRSPSPRRSRSRTACACS
mgnify:CR=1 FL=1